MSFLDTLSIRRRLLLGSLVPAALIGIFVSIFFVVNASRSLDESLRDQGLAITGFLAPASEYGTISGNRDSLTALLQATLGQRPVRGAAVLDHLGHTMAISGPLTLPSINMLKAAKGPTATPPTDRALGFIAPIRRSPVDLGELLDAPDARTQRTDVIGWVYVELDLGPLAQRKKDLLLANTALLMLYIALAAWIANRIAGAVTGPVVALARAVNAMAEGRTSTRVREDTGGELGELERGFNNMAHALEEMHHDMQSRIDSATAQLSHLANHDVLTGLPNRRAFEQATSEAIAVGRRRGDQHVLCFIDLDRFKIVNDTCGHAAGDELLCRIAALLRSRVREQDMVSRMGGDEFAVLLSDCGIENAHRIAENLRAAVENFRFVREERSFSVGASVGLVALGDHVHDLNDALAAADQACYEAKRRGRNLVVEARAEHIQGNGAMPAPTQDDSVEEMIGAGRLSLDVQPILRADGLPQPWLEVLLRIDGEPAGLAAILHDARGPEAGGLKLDTWVLERTAEALGRMHAQYPACRHMKASLNVGRHSLLASRQYCVALKLAIARYQISPWQLIFELGADLAAQLPGEAAAFVEEARILGCGIVLDRFTDQSPALLRAIGPDYVKIRYDLLVGEYGPSDALALGDGLAGIAARTGYSVIVAGIEEGNSISPRVQDSFYLQGNGLVPPVPLEQWRPDTVDGQEAETASGEARA